MKRYIFFIFIMFILASCNSIKKADDTIVKPEIESSGITTSDAVEQLYKTELPIINTAGTNWTDFTYNNCFNRSFIYNPYDNCFYISLPGERIITDSERGDNKNSYPWDPPEIERFCKMNVKTGEVSRILDYRINNLVYCDGYVYFNDDSTIKRIKDDKIEDVLKLSKTYGDRLYIESFYIEDNYLYLINRQEGIYVLDLESLNEIDDMRFYVSADSLYQIYDGTIYSFSDKGLFWKKGTGELSSYLNTHNLIKSFYGDKIQENSITIDSFIFYGNLLVQFKEDLFLINLETNEIELIANNVTKYTFYNDCVYYISQSDDALYIYNIETKETTLIISFLENETEDYDPDYFGYENLYEIIFINGRCFLNIVGMKTYSYARIAELNLESKDVNYFTKYFNEKTNVITSFYGGPFSFEYPNDYSVFIDYGSGGGTVISNYEKHIRFHINGMGMPLMDISNFNKDITKQGLSIYYKYDAVDGIQLSAVIKDEANDWPYIKIIVTGNLGNIKLYEDEILEILKSMYWYGEV